MSYIDTSKTLFINCDMGEWDATHLENNDHSIMPFIDLCNVACGGHAGSIDIMKETIGLAIENEVEVGAHFGYIDRSHFGRVYVELSEQELRDLFRSQIETFLNLVDIMDVIPYHIKPHGALYHACNHRSLEMNILIDVIKNEYSHLVLLVYPDSILHTNAEAQKLSYMTESFIDRQYTDDMNLLPRSDDKSVLTSVEKAVSQFDCLTTGKIITESGLLRDLSSQTACIHGDNPNALQILQSIQI